MEDIVDVFVLLAGDVWTGEDLSGVLLLLERNV